MHLTRKQSLIITAVLLGFFGIAGTTVIRKSREDSPASPVVMPPAPPQGEGPRIVLNRFQRSETKDGRKMWEVDAERGEYLAVLNTAKVEKAVLTVYRPDDTVVRLSAPHATIHLKGTGLSNAEVGGGIELVYGTDFKLHTESAVYDHERGIVTAPGITTITGERFRLQGDQIAADAGERSLELTGNVKTVFHPKKELP